MLETVIIIAVCVCAGLAVRSVKKGGGCGSCRDCPNAATCEKKDKKRDG